MEIKTNRLLIRKLKIEDLLGFHQYRSNPEITKYQGFDVMTLEQAKTFIKSNAEKSFGKAGEWVQYAIANIENNKLIGDCAIKLQEDPRIAEVGITISDLFQRKGYAKETMLGILGFLFEEAEVLRVVETLGEDNIASVKLLESLGFRKEGHFLENVFFKGKWDSEYQYAMLSKEWFSKQKAK